MGERSSRKIEKLCEKDIAFRVIADNQHPDHTQIARFRRKNEAELSALFVEVLRLCAAGKVGWNREIGQWLFDGYIGRDFDQIEKEYVTFCKKIVYHVRLRRPLKKAAGQ